MLSYKRGNLSRGIEIHSSPQPRTVGEDIVSFEAIVPPHGEWRACLEIHPVIEGTVIKPRYRCGQSVERAMPAERLARWRAKVPQVQSDDDEFRRALERSAEDLGALRIFDPDYPERVVVAAGAPWFMTVFGRDSLITSWMALIVDPDLALGVLQTLARSRAPKSIRELTSSRAGSCTRCVSATLHLFRSVAGASTTGQRTRHHFSSCCSESSGAGDSPLKRWTAFCRTQSVLSNGSTRSGTPTGTVTSSTNERPTGASPTRVGRTPGTASVTQTAPLPHAPIALCEVQAYVYSAYLARAHFAHEAGDEATYERFRSKAARLKTAFNRDFWLEDKGWYAVGLDGDKRPIDSLTSNIGHCLWTGIVDDDKAKIVADLLMSKEMFSGWGIRTLASSMGGYNPVSYHCGSVWPHDTAIVAAGLSRYGLNEQALRIVRGLLDSAQTLGARLPELFSGLDRTELSVPVSYPTSCSPQAWAAASPLLCLRTILRLDPWVPYGKTWLAPLLPEGMKRLKVEGIPLAGSRVSVEVEGDDVQIEGLPTTLELVARTPRPVHRCVGSPMCERHSVV